ncbi:MBL fold metallo-hydrolase [Paracidovorax cattleyae]|uniref:Glyoxylase, beta-lactamase superfamily II n=2 Tax=Paracidovorax cattleyae TaxID=80868 RepID=A0A1H0UHW4_9BURK|nr:MBL fold metallo-hydrolase [Paracidovorax cattleyae]SDP65680.1 Glyoxylase, beta-lactamase superfamily II [Paracidovorax cattleyae]
MPRLSQQLHPHREPAATRAAATVLLLRDAPGGGLEVLMTRRSPQASFAPGAYVFPGGAIDPQDAEPATHSQADRRPAQTQDRVTQAVAAIRESFEELGVLLARRPDGHFATEEDIAALDRGAPFIAQCAARGLRLAADAVFLLAHWTADRDLPRRFDVPFLVARMPQGQEPVADETEQFEPVWVRPRDALDRHAAGQFFMIFPTIRTLERLAEFAGADAVLAAVAHEQPLWTSCPRAGLLAGREARYMEHEAPYGELALVCPDGQIVHPLDWQPERSVPLLRNLQRLTAANPGAMTGPGTNSYLVGDPSTGYIAIDPGPADEAHLERLWHAAGGDIRAIVCTHSHADHAPGAAPLAARVAAAGRPRPPVLGLPSAPTARAASRFTPDRALADGERITLSGRQLEGDVTHTLEVVHTPGHAANHLCLLLHEDGLLFSGDHILNGSTTAIDPPDGNMDDYLASLDRLDALCERHGVEFILPAHGHAIAGAREAIARLKAHRLAREAKVLAAMQALPDGSMDDWVRHAYADVPERLWPVAQRSLLAHVERLRALEAGHA